MEGMAGTGKTKDLSKVKDQIPTYNPCPSTMTF